MHFKYENFIVVGKPAENEIRYISCSRIDTGTKLRRHVDDIDRKENTKNWGAAPLRFETGGPRTKLFEADFLGRRKSYRHQMYSSDRHVTLVYIFEISALSEVYFSIQKIPNFQKGHVISRKNRELAS